MLAVGQTLVIPNVVANVHNSSSTFKVYNPNEQLGDISPTLPDPPPPPKEDCDVAGIIFVALVVVVVTIITDGILSEYAASLGSELIAATAAAAGNAAGQEAAKSVGLREHFSLREVGAAAATALIPNVTGIGVVDAAIKEAAAQQIRRAFHVQSGFDWAALAAAPIGEAVGEGVSSLFPNAPDYASLRGAVSSAAQSVATQGVSILIKGEGKIQWASVASAALNGAIAGARAGQKEALTRANLQDYYRDMEGSTILSDSSRFAGDVARDREGSSILSDTNPNGNLRVTGAGLLGSGLRATAEQMAAWGPQYSLDLPSNPLDLKLIPGVDGEPLVPFGVVTGGPKKFDASEDGAGTVKVGSFDNSDFLTMPKAIRENLLDVRRKLEGLDVSLPSGRVETAIYTALAGQYQGKDFLDALDKASVDLLNNPQQASLCVTRSLSI